MSAIFPPPERVWWKQPLDRVEGTWIVIAFAWCLVMFFMMPYWHVYGEQNYSSEAYRVLPQKYLERICANIADDEFRATLNEVIFRYVKPQDQNGKENLDDLIQYRTQQAQEDIAQKKQELRQTNANVVAVEKKLIFFGAAYGPWVGLLAGLIGNTLGDLFTGWGLYWNWSVGNGLMGMIPGLIVASINDFRARADIIKAVGWGTLGIVVGMLFASLTEMFVGGIDFNTALIGYFVPAFLGNFIVTVILLPILMIAFAAATASLSVAP